MFSEFVWQQLLFSVVLMLLLHSIWLIFFMVWKFSLFIFCDPSFDYLMECEVPELVIATGALCYALWERHRVAVPFEIYPIPVSSRGEYFYYLCLEPPLISPNFFGGVRSLMCKCALLGVLGSLLIFVLHEGSLGQVEGLVVLVLQCFWERDEMKWKWIYCLYNSDDMSLWSDLSVILSMRAIV
jgi:hypothetical protein